MCVRCVCVSTAVVEDVLECLGFSSLLNILYNFSV